MFAAVILIKLFWESIQIIWLVLMTVGFTIKRQKQDMLQPVMSVLIGFYAKKNLLKKHFFK